MEHLTEFDYFRIILESLNSQLEMLCKDTGSLFLREVFEAVEDPEMDFALQPELTSDGAHFNYAGYETIGRTLCAALQDRGGDELVKEGARVLLLGDSITAGYPEYEPLLIERSALNRTSELRSSLLLGASCGDERHSFGYYLRTVLGLEVANRGISGDLTSSMVRRLDGYLAPPPDLVILQGGANDAFHSLPFRESRRTGERSRHYANEIFSNLSCNSQNYVFL